MAKLFRYTIQIDTIRLIFPHLFIHGSKKLIMHFLVIPIYETFRKIMSP